MGAAGVNDGRWQRALGIGACEKVIGWQKVLKSNG